MIIVAGSDGDSIHTLVQIQNPLDSNVLVPHSLANLTYAACAASITPFAFALTHFTISYKQAIPTVVTFGLSLPLYLGATILVCNEAPFRWMPSKAIILGYVVLLVALWTFSAIESAQVLADIWEELVICAAYTSGRHSISTNPHLSSRAILFQLPCIQEPAPRATLLISAILALVQVVLLGTIARIVARWNIKSFVDHHETPSQDSPVCFHWSYRFFLPLTYTSLGISIPPLILVLLHLHTPAIYPYAVATAVAGTLTSSLHVVGFVQQYRLRAKTAEDHMRSNCSSYPSAVFLLLLIWLISLIMGCRNLLGNGFWEGVCYPWEPTIHQCKSRVAPRFIVCVVLTSLQIASMSMMLFMYSRRLVASVDQRAPESDSPQEPNIKAKGPILAQSESV